MSAILHDRLPFTSWADPAMRRLPGIQPADPESAFQVDEVFGLQMAERDRLIRNRSEDVLACFPEAAETAGELLETAVGMAAKRQGFDIEDDHVCRPDGVRVILDRTRPLATLGRLFQADFCLLEKQGSSAEHVLTGAVLCFPASWTLAEKIGRPLHRIHGPVASYDANMAKRVQRLFDTLKPDRALWRANALLYDCPDLFQPRREGEGRLSASGGGGFLRSERQVLFRLPRSGAVVFSIHTFVVPLDRLDPAQRQILAKANLDIS